MSTNKPLILLVSYRRVAAMLRPAVQNGEFPQNAHQAPGEGETTLDEERTPPSETILWKILMRKFLIRNAEKIF
jgi:hypothetical protein